MNEATIKKYIKEQESHDIAKDKLTEKEYTDLFKGASNTKAPSGAATSQIAIGLNVSESEGLKSQLEDLAL